MIKEKYLSFLQDKYRELAKKYGLPDDGPIVTHGYREVAVVEYDHEFANKYRDAISHVADELVKLDGIKDLGDYRRDEVLRGGEVRNVEMDVKRGLWYVGPLDKELDDEFDRECEDDEYAEQKNQERRNKQLKYYKDYLLPIPKPAKDATDQAFLILDGENYDLIAKGEKTSEFRRYGQFWVKRLCSHPIKTVVFQRGYGGPGHPPPEKMTWVVERVYLYDYNAKIECEPGRTDVPLLPDWIVLDLGARIDGQKQGNVG